MLGVCNCYVACFCSHLQTLLAAVDSATDEEERTIIVTYIAFTEHPQPLMIAELEERIGSDPHSTDPLLLAYGALVAKASPDLQHRMTLFLLSRLPLVEGNSSSLIHHILSLGNTESHQTTSYLTDYLWHTDHQVQASAIYSLRYATSDRQVQKALSTLVSHPNVSDEHLVIVLRCLLYGIEHASNTYTEKTFNSDLARALLSSVVASDNEDLQYMFASYLQAINSADSSDLLTVLVSSTMIYSNSTRSKRGTNWAENNGVYNLVSPLSTRQSDVRRYSNFRAYIWGKKFGVSKANVQIAAGGFIGVSPGLDYKIYGRAKAVGHAFGRTKTALDFLVLREKSNTATTRLYAEIIGKVLLNIRETSSVTRCRTHTRPLYNRRKYTLFDFGYSIFIYVATIRFNIAGYIGLNTNLKLQFCQLTEKLTAEAGVETTITVELQAGASANLLVSFALLL